MKRMKMFLAAIVCFCLVGAVCVHIHDWIEVGRRYDAILAGYDDLLADYQTILASYEALSADYSDMAGTLTERNTGDEAYDQMSQRIEEAEQKADRLHEWILKVKDEEYLKRLADQYGEEEAKYRQSLELEYLRLEYNEALELKMRLQNELDGFRTPSSNPPPTPHLSRTDIDEPLVILNADGGPDGPNPYYEPGCDID